MSAHIGDHANEWMANYERTLADAGPYNPPTLTDAERRAKHEEQTRRMNEANLERIRQSLPKRLQAATIESPLPAGGLYVYGRPGAGKSWAVAATVLAVAAEGTRALWLNVPTFIDQIKVGYNNEEHRVPPPSDFLESVDLLVMDDLGAERPSDWVRETLYLTVNTAYENQITTIVTSNLKPQELMRSLGERLVSRLLEDARVVHFTGPDRRLGVLQEPVMRGE